MQPGRRAFFRAGRVPDTPWAQCCQRLARVAAGRLEDESVAGRPPRARLSAARVEDVHHALALCREAGVTLADAHAGVPAPAGPCLWVDTTALRGHGPLDKDVGFITVAPGEPVGALRETLRGSGWQAAGLAGVPDTQTVGAWFATAAGWRPGHCADSGVQAVDVLLADGQPEQLGTFGTAATRPVGPALRSLVSELFLLAGSPAATAARAQAVWTPRYRLDALLPDTPADALPIPNLGHLLLGARNSLAWVERLHLRLQRDDVAPPVLHGATATGQDDIDRVIKRGFDPTGRFAVAFV